jgi:hypothetical protein
MVFNKNYEGIITNGLVLNLDAGFIPSYPTNGTTWYDLSYGGNNGTLTNGPTYNTLDGGSIVFDGVDDETSFTNGTFGYSPGTTGEISLEIWIYPTGPYTSYVAEPPTTNLGGFIGQGYFGGSTGWGIGMFRSNGNNYFAFQVRNQGTVVQTGENNNHIFTNNNWYHVVGSFTRNNFSRVYINGVLASSTDSTPLNNISLTPSAANAQISTINTFYAGCRLSVGRIYNRPLSQTEVLQNYNAGLSRFNTSNIVKNNLILDLNASNAVSYPTTGTVWRDLSGYGNAGTLINGPTFNSTTKSIVFDGSDDYVNCGSNPSLDILRTVTMELLFKVTGFGSPWTNVFGKMNADGDVSSRCYSAFINSAGYVHFVTADSSGQDVLDSTTFISTDVWYHWVGTINRNTGVMTQYVNGVLNSTGGVRTTDIITNTSPLRVGYAGSYYQRYNGSVSIARIYNKSLTTSEILQNYYGAPIITDGLVMALDAGNLVSYPGSGTSWRDLTSNANNVTLVNGPTFNSNDGGSIVLDGTDDYIVSSNLPTNSPLSFSDGNFTIEHWIRITAYEPSTYFGLTNMIMSKGPASTYNYATQVTNSTTLSFIHRDNSEGLVFLNFTVPTLTNNITQIVFSITLTQVSLYLNGMLSETKNLTGNPITPYSYDELVIGGMYSTSNTNFTGNMYIHRIYNKPLSNNEVSQNYSATKSRFGL